MTEEYIYNIISHILQTIDKDKYKEIAYFLTCAIDDEGGVYYEPFELACNLHDSDAAQALPKEVADFIIEIYLDEIEKGNEKAMTNLGSFYYMGRSGKQDYEKAVKYYTMADEHGERQATENLGYCYYYGRTGEVDYEKAFHYFVKGALNNSLNSLYKIGDMYRNGYYVKKDEKEAFDIYTRCYEQMSGDYIIRTIGADICMRMGDVYFYGIGAEKNYETALKYYQEAERHFYQKITDGDFFARSGLRNVIEKQSLIREELMEGLPSFDWI